MVIPVIVGLVMFGTGWISGVAPFLPDRATAMLAMPALLAILISLGFSIFSATGEEIGWRGLLVPELGRITTFTWIAIISAIIWFLWHLPLMVVGAYGDGSFSSMVLFFLSLIGGSTLFAWIRLASGSIWPAALLHGFCRRAQLSALAQILEIIGIGREHYAGAGDIQALEGGYRLPDFG